MALIVYNRENSRPQEVTYKGKRTINLDSRGTVYLSKTMFCPDRFRSTLAAVNSRLLCRMLPRPIMPEIVVPIPLTLPFLCPVFPFSYCCHFTIQVPIR